MSRNDLDDTHELDKPDEGFRASAASSKWLEGTSRDLMSKLERPRAESADVATSAIADAVDRPVDGHTAADLDVPHDTSKNHALHDIKHSDVSEAPAQHVESELAPSTDHDQRERAPVQVLSAVHKDTHEAIKASLATDVPTWAGDSARARAELDNSERKPDHDDSEVESLRTTLNPVLIEAQREIVQEVNDNAAYKAKFVSGEAGLAGIHAAELARPVVDLIHHDMAGVAEGLMSAQEHASGLIESVTMLREGLEFPVIPDEVRQRAQAISEWWKTLNPPPDKPHS